MDDGSDPARDLHSVEMTALLNLGNDAALPPSNRRRVGAHASGIDADNQRPMRLDLFLSRPQDEIGRNEAVALRRNERLRRDQRIFLGEVFLPIQVARFSPYAKRFDRQAHVARLKLALACLSLTAEG